MADERSKDGRCSPRTQRKASTIFDLPHPFGPTIDVIPLSKETFVLWAKLLNPCRFSSDIYKDASHKFQIPVINLQKLR